MSRQQSESKSSSSSTAKVLLTDHQMQSFIAHGFVVLDSSLPLEFHQKIFADAETLFRSSGDQKPASTSGRGDANNPGNNILPVLPELGHLLTDPVVDGALTSILGERYSLHPHRHCHRSIPGRNAQPWHKDSYFGFSKHRHLRNEWAMLMYYPQKTTLEMGPTAILPGTHCLSTQEGDRKRHLGKPLPNWGTAPLNLTCEAGTVVIIHYDLWHKATNNTSRDLTRYMFKFQFLRTSEPVKPTWNHQSPDWIFGREPTEKSRLAQEEAKGFDQWAAHPFQRHVPGWNQARELLWHDVWRWHMGQGNGVKTSQTATVVENEQQQETKKEEKEAEQPEPEPEQESEAFVEMRDVFLAGDLDDPEHLDLAMQLATTFPRLSARMLVAQLYNPRPHICRNSMYALGTMGPSVASLLVKVLANSGSSAPPRNTVNWRSVGGKGKANGGARKGNNNNNNTNASNKKQEGQISNKQAGRNQTWDHQLDTQAQARSAACFALFTIGPAATQAPGCVEQLIQTLNQDPSPIVQRDAAEALGNLVCMNHPAYQKNPKQEALMVTALSRALTRGGDEVKMNAALALLRLRCQGVSVESALSALRKTAEQGQNRYTMAYALEAVVRQETSADVSKSADDAVEAMVRQHMHQRMCPHTNSQSPF